MYTFCKQRCVTESTARLLFLDSVRVFYFLRVWGSSSMSATWSTMPQPAMFAGKNRTRRMPSRTHMYAMCAATAATASILLIGTGVVTSVSFFVLGLVLLTSLVALI